MNLSSLGSDAGVSHTTAREWLTLLETSYIIFQQPPFHANIGKRLTKSPKLYFYDVGLAPQLVSRTFEVVERLRAGGTTILMVEQMARQALRVSDRAYVLEHGRIVHQGASSELLDDARVLGAYLGSGRQDASPTEPRTEGA